MNKKPPIQRSVMKMNLIKLVRNYRRILPENVYMRRIYTTDGLGGIRMKKIMFPVPGGPFITEKAVTIHYRGMTVFSIKEKLFDEFDTAFKYAVSNLR